MVCRCKKTSNLRKFDVTHRKLDNKDVTIHETIFSSPTTVDPDGPLGVFERGYSELSLEIDAEGVSDVVPHGAVAAHAVAVGPLRVQLHAGRVDALDERLLPSPQLELVPDEDVAVGGDVRTAGSGK